MLELVILLAVIFVGGLALIFWLNVTAEWAERDQLRRFQEAMRAGGRDHPLPHKRED